MELTIRPIKEDDYEQFEQLYLDLLEFDRVWHPQRDEPEFERIVAARRAKAREQLVDREHHALLIATNPSKITIGYTIIHIVDPGPASTDGAMLTGVVHELYVTAAARGSGAGSALMEAAEAWFRERGAKRVKVEAFAWNTEAIRFYERRGYAVSDVILTRWL